MNNINTPLHFREKDFKRNIERLGIKAEVCMDTFLLPNNTKYTPDFYLPQLNCYVEVIGSRQAYTHNLEKYQTILFSHAFNILFITSDFSFLAPELFLRLKNRPCSIKECPFQSIIKNLSTQSLCLRHTHQLKNLGECEKTYNDPDFIKNYHLKNKKKCSILSCTRLVNTRKGMCKQHYNHFKYSQKTQSKKNQCWLKGCTKVKYARGYCYEHYLKSYNSKSQQKNK